MGTPEFAVPSLKILVENQFEVVAVITATDKMGGRGRKKLLQSPIKKYAIEKGIDVLQPKNLKNKEFVNLLKSYQADLQIVVAFRMLPEVVWNMPAKGTMNLHGSLLPSYRGAAPIHWAVINGETETGVTTFLLKHEIDTGDLLFQETMPIHQTDTTGDVHDRMMAIGADLVLRSAKALASNVYETFPQKESAVTKAPKLHTAMCEINLDQSVEIVYNFIRGLNPFPTAWIKINEKKFKIYACEKDYECKSIQRIFTDQNQALKLRCSDGYINVLSLQKEGSRRMEIKEFLNGHTIEEEI